MDLSYTLLRSGKRRKTLCLQVARDGRIVIRAPLFTPQDEIEKFFLNKLDWLRDRLRKRDRLPEERSPRAFREGETFLFMGTAYPLRIEPADSALEGRLFFDSRHFVLGRSDPARGREIFTAWYEEQARRHIGERLEEFSRRLELFPRSFRITAARSFWGSCSAADRLAFNWRLIMAPCSVIDYVIVHELQHLAEKNHSPAFWKRVALVIPDYRDRKLWLRKNGSFLNL
jgi:predicted metal-dependent hydrolase